MAVQTDIQEGLDTRRRGAFSWTDIDGTGAQSLTDGRYWHLNITADAGGSGALATAINAKIGVTLHTVTCTFDATNLLYTLSGSGNFSFTLGSALANYLGAPTFGGTIGGATSGHSSYTSSVRPYGIIRPVGVSTSNTNPFGGMSNVSDNYHPGESLRVRRADDGKSQYGISPLTLTTFRDFAFACERDTPLFDGGTYSTGSKGHALMTRNGTSTVPWAWEDFFNAIRGEEFFAFASQTNPPTAATADVYKLRQETCTLSTSARQRRTPDYGLWDVRMSVMLYGSQ